MNLFPLQRPVSQIDTPTEHPALRAYMQGLQAGKEIPTPAKALADAFTTGLEAYHGEVQNQQREESNYFAIEANKLALQQRQADMQNMQAREQLEAAQLQQSRDEIARQTRERQEEDELIGMLQEGDTNQLTEALISGQHIGAFSRNPKLEEAVIKRVGPSMPDGIYDYYEKGQNRRQAQTLSEKYALKHKEAYEKAMSNVVGSELITDIQANGGPSDIRELVRDIDIIDPSEYVFKDGYMLLNDDDTPMRPTGYDPLKKDNNLEDPTRKKWAVSRKQRKVYSTNVTPEDAKSLFAARGAAKNLGNTEINESRSLSLLKQARGERPDVVDKENSKLAPRTATPQESQDDIISKLIQPKTIVGRTPLSLSQATEELQKQPLVDSSNRVSFVASKDVPRLVVNSLAIPEKAANNNIKETRDYLKEVTRDGSRYSKIFARQNFVKKILLDSYPELSDEQKSSYDRVTEHNAQVNNRAKAIEKRGYGDTRVAVGPPPLGGMTLVNSPEELYVLEESERLNQRLDSLEAEMRRAAEQQLKMQSDKSLQRSNIVNAVRNLVG